MNLRSFHRDARRQDATIIGSPKLRILRNRVIERAALSTRNHVINRRASAQPNSIAMANTKNRASLPVNVGMYTFL